MSKGNHAETGVVPSFGRGRIAGVKNRFSKASVDKLAALGFCVIEQQVLLYDEIQREIEDQKLLKKFTRLRPDGSEERYSAKKHMELLGIQQRILDSLMRYGYARVPEGVSVDAESPPGIVINLTKSEFKIADVEVAT